MFQYARGVVAAAERWDAVFALLSGVLADGVMRLGVFYAADVPGSSSVSCVPLPTLYRFSSAAPLLICFHVLFLLLSRVNIFSGRSFVVVVVV